MPSLGVNAITRCEWDHKRLLECASLFPLQLTEVNVKWDAHCRELQETHKEEVDEIKSRSNEIQVAMKKQVEEALKELKTEIKNLKVSRI